MAVINVTSEIGKLKKVLLHRPGEELLNLTPNTLNELLFDDIPFLKNAQAEHDYFAKLFQENGVEVVYLEDLMAETLDSNDHDIKEQFIRQFIEEGNVNNKKYKEALLQYFNAFSDSKELVLKMMAGINLKEIELGNDTSLVDMTTEKNRMLLPPMPNLYFQRDPFASVGNGVMINKMKTFTRCRETIFADYIFRYHKDYKDVERYYNRTEAFSIEGGDVLNISKDTLAIGISQRTEADAIEKLARNIFYHSNNSSIKTILAFDIPKTRAFMHLDTVFTQIDHDKFTIHPGIMGTLRVFEITKSKTGTIDGINIVEMEDTLEHILEKYLERKIELILCAGGDRIAAEREQWNDGSNTLCIAPGTIIVYDRNDVTNKILVDKGLNVLEMPSGEVSRGRGGPRCMSMPLVREDL